MGLNFNVELPDMQKARLQSELIEEARSRNALLALQEQETHRQMAQDDAFKQVLKQYQSQGGDPAELVNRVMQINPKAAETLQKHFDTQQDRKMKLMNHAVEVLSSVEGLPEEQRPQAYQMGLKSVLVDYPELRPMLGERIPAQYNPVWSRQALQSMIPAAEKFKAEQNQWGTPIAAQDAQGNDIFITPNKRVPGAVQTQIGGAGGAGGITPRPQRPLVDINQQQESEESKAYGRHLVEKEYTPIVERANQASDLLGNLKIAKGIDISTGALEPAKNRISSYVQALGIDPVQIGLPNASNAQALTGIMQNIVLQKMIAQKGPQTENDAKRIEATVANLGQTPQAFKFLMNAAAAIEERAIEQRNFYDLYRNKKGTFNGAGQAWNDFKEMTPMVIRNPKTGLPVFFNEFKEANPNVPIDQLLQAWRKASRGGE